MTQLNKKRSENLTLIRLFVCFLLDAVYRATLQGERMSPLGTRYFCLKTRTRKNIVTKPGFDRLRNNMVNTV